MIEKTRVVIEEPRLGLMLSLAEARARILERAEPGEAIEVALAEALGLVLAEPVVADVDLPPFDRAALDGYAVRAADALPGARLRVVGVEREDGEEEFEVEREEAARVTTGDPMPVGTDAVLRTEDSRPEPGLGPPKLVEVLRPSSRRKTSSGVVTTSAQEPNSPQPEPPSDSRWSACSLRKRACTRSVIAVSGWRFSPWEIIW